jgi:DNA-binding NtrC family response regulator
LRAKILRNLRKPFVNCRARDTVATSWVLSRARREPFVVEAESMRSDRTKVLLADGDEHTTREFAGALRSAGFVVEATADGAQAIALLQSGIRVDVVITELTLSGIAGVDLLSSLHRLAPEVPVLIVTASPSLDSAIAAIEQAAFRYFPRPVAA